MTYNFFFFSHISPAAPVLAKPKPKVSYRYAEVKIQFHITFASNREPSRV
jgi:hypothetical protein